MHRTAEPVEHLEIDVVVRLGAAPAAMSPIRTVPLAVATLAEADKQYLMAAAGSSSIEPKLPWPSTSGYRIENGWARRTRVS